MCWVTAEKGWPDRSHKTVRNTNINLFQDASPHYIGPHSDLFLSLNFLCFMIRPQRKLPHLLIPFLLPLNSFCTQCYVQLSTYLHVVLAWVLPGYFFCLPSKWESPLKAVPCFRDWNPAGERCWQLQGTGELTMCCLIASWQITRLQVLFCGEKTPVPLLWIRPPSKSWSWWSEIGHRPPSNRLYSCFSIILQR